MARRKTTKRKPAKKRTTKKSVTRRTTRRAARTTKKTPIAKWLFILGLVGILLSFTGIYSSTVGITTALVFWLLAFLMKR